MANCMKMGGRVEKGGVEEIMSLQGCRGDGLRERIRGDWYRGPLGSCNYMSLGGGVALLLSSLMSCIWFQRFAKE